MVRSGAVQGGGGTVQGGGVGQWYGTGGKQQYGLWGRWYSTGYGTTVQRYGTEGRGRVHGTETGD